MITLAILILVIATGSSYVIAQQADIDYGRNQDAVVYEIEEDDVALAQAPINVADINSEEITIEYDDSGSFYDGLGPDRSTSVYKWGADLTSLYAFLENGDPDILTGHDVWTDDVYNETMAFLSNAWNIKDRDSAIEVINRTINSGYNTKFIKALDEAAVEAAVDVIKNDFGDDFSFEDAVTIDKDYFSDNGVYTDKFYRVKGAACAYARFGENGLKAYDYLRIIRVVSLSYQCGFLTLEENNELLYEIETALQDSYMSFKDIHECYYYGEMFRVGFQNDYNDDLISAIEDTISEMSEDSFYAKIEGYYDTELTFPD